MDQTTATVLNLLFGAVGVASLVLSGFAIWLSWQFYREARSQSDRVSDAISRMEAVVNAVQVHMQQIVQKTVETLLNSQSPDTGASTVLEVQRGFEELSGRVNKLLDTNALPQADLIKAEIQKFAVEQEQRTEQLVNSFREQRVRALLPDLPKAVTARVDLVEQDNQSEVGIMTLNVVRPVPIATGSARFATSFSPLPDLVAELVSKPPTAPTPRHNCGVGPSGRFNIHLNGADGGLVQPGEYHVKYVATAKQPETLSTDRS